MEKREIFAAVDHTLLKACATWDEIKVLCDEAVTYETASVCIPPSYVGRVRAMYPRLRICTVIGFPLGYSVTAVKAAEIENAVNDGADEVDAVVNLGDVKNRDFDTVTREIATLKKAAAGKVLKIIVETCYLDETEKIALCKAVTMGGADYIKTSTGFGTGGAVMDDIILFKKHIGPSVKIKASGGIKTREDMEAFLAAGCERLGTSSAVKILTV